MKSVLLLSGAALAVTTAIAIADPRPNADESAEQRSESVDRPHRGGGMMMQGMRGMHGMGGMQGMRGMMMGEGHGIHAQMHARMHGNMDGDRDGDMHGGMHGGQMDRSDMHRGGGMHGGGMHGYGGQYPRPSQPDQK